jgi:hypothetical protein
MLRPMLRSTLLAGVCLMVAIGSLFAQGRARKPPPLTDLQLIAKLHELTRAKGDYAKRLGPGFCRRLGVRPIGFCEAFEVQFAEGGQPAATFYSLDDGRNGMVRIFITSYLDPNYAEDYRVDAEGRLERAVRRRGQTSSHLAVKDVGPGFKRVMDFLRNKPDELADWPDATIVDDGSCPKGQVKRVPRQASHAVCIDRKRLRMN